ncbi:MAG: fibronectin type III-like domain-contianing protein [Clostridiales bacterium]|nr:fibronectin type III-like domain-contianing protein [Clostridiales bacterium]
MEHREGIYVGYRYYDTAGKDVLFPFGHGLSYTTFRYADMKLSRETMDENGSVTVSFRVTNTGDRDGAEAVQIYVAPQDSAVFRADQELKGFDKVFLKAGESKAVSVTLDSRAFAYYHTQIKDWYCEPGAYEIRVGASSRDIRLSTQVQIQNSRELSSPYDKTALPAYYQARVHQVPDHEFQQLLGFQIPEAIRGKGKPFTFNSTFDEARDTKWGRRIIRLIRIFSPKDDGGMGNTEMMEAMAVETPIRSMVNMSQGALSEEMGQAILDLLNDRQTGKALRTLMKGGLKLLKRR